MGKYNLTEKKEKNAAYRSLVRAELVDELYEKILKVFVVPDLQSFVPVLTALSLQAICSLSMLVFNNKII